MSATQAEQDLTFTLPVAKLTGDDEGLFERHNHATLVAQREEARSQVEQRLALAAPVAQCTRAHQAFLETPDRLLRVAIAADLAIRVGRFYEIAHRDILTLDEVLLTSIAKRGVNRMSETGYISVQYRDPVLYSPTNVIWKTPYINRIVSAIFTFYALQRGGTRC